MWSPQNYFHRYIYNPVIFPGEDNGIIYIATTDFFKLMCHAREVFPGRGFSSGACIAEKWGLEIFWGKCLKRTRFSDIFSSVIKFPGEDSFMQMNKHLLRN